MRGSINPAASGASPALTARIEEKKAELENLKELRDLSAAIAIQMEALEQKLATLSGGTEGACILAVSQTIANDASHCNGSQQLA
jgi:DASH complex subunit DAD2